jgi:hypothetical protein
MPVPGRMLPAAHVPSQISPWMHHRPSGSTGGSAITSISVAPRRSTASWARLAGVQPTGT